MAHGPAQEMPSFSLEITPANPLPQAKLRAKVNAAIAEASAEFRRQHSLSVKISGTADGGLFDLGASWPWVIHFGGSVLGKLLYGAGEEAAKEAGKEFGKKAGRSFYELLKESLRSRNLTVSKPYDLRLFPDPNHPYASLPPAPERAVKKPRRKRKSARKSSKGKNTRKKKAKWSTTTRKRR